MARLNDKLCATCGATFKGATNAIYCPDCRAERQRQQTRVNSLKYYYRNKAERNERAKQYVESRLENDPNYRAERTDRIRRNQVLYESGEFTDTLAEKVSAMWANSESMESIANDLEISPYKVQKILITLGLYSTDLSCKIKPLLEQGMSTNEISEKLGISPKTICYHSPYKKGMYRAEHTTPNALVLRKHRVKKEQKKEQKND